MPCPWCQFEVVEDDTATYWCPQCEIAWFKWSEDQEHLRLSPPLAPIIPLLPHTGHVLL
jgi:hypothetical protein